MKRLVVSVIATLLTGLAGFIISCDKIDPPYLNVVDVSDCPVPTFPDVTTPQKTVLIEEFTGHLCINCPTAAYYVHQIQQSYGSKVVVLAIHPSGNGSPEPGNYSLDLRPGSHADELHLEFQIPAEPRAMFNREKLDGTNINYGAPDTWQAKVDTILSEDPVITMQVINNYDAATRKLCTHIKTKFLTANSQNLKIAVWIAEDSIVGYQKNNNAAVGTTPEISDYVFMDVMRDEFVGTYGEGLTNGGVAQDSAVIRSYKKTLPAEWVDRHCKVVAYVYVDDVDIHTILQAVEGKVIE
jgi:hypothetical protein